MSLCEINGVNQMPINFKFCSTCDIRNGIRGCLGWFGLCCATLKLRIDKKNEDVNLNISYMDMSLIYQH